MKKSQSEQILEYMKEHGSITALEATVRLNCLRLAARISDLKKEGHLISSVMEVHKSQDGTTSHYKRYFLIQ
jgi:hypothetical protein